MLVSLNTFNGQSVSFRTAFTKSITVSSDPKPTFSASPTMSYWNIFIA